MDKYHREQAEFRYMLDDYICQVCKVKRASQQAHRIPQTKANLKRYGKKIIHHNINLVSVCSLDCNKVVDIGTVADQGKVDKIIELIKITDILLTAEIDNILLYI